MNTAVSNHYSGVKRFLPAIVIILLGLGASLLWHPFVWPFAIGGAIASVVSALVKKNPDPDARKFFNGLSLTFFISALTLGAFGVIAVFVASL